MAFGFKQQAEVGAAGELWLRENYHSRPLQKVDSKSPVGDFIRSDGKIIEVKTDTYPLIRTPNFFIEFYSDEKKKKMGGPWRAFEQGADIFLYLFSDDKVYYEFEDVQALVLRTEDLIKKKKLKPVGILNRTWITTGYKIEREWLKDLWKEYRTDDPSKET